MKSIKHIIVSLSLVILCLGYSKPVNSSALKPTITNSVTTAQHVFAYSTQSIPSSTHIQIRHRSPHEVDEISVPAHTMQLLYTIQIAALEKEYLTRWKNYFYVQDDALPQDQAYLPTRPLRAPPVTC